MQHQENEEARIQVAQQELEEERMFIEEEAARKTYQAEEACKAEDALKALEAQEEARKAHEAEQAREIQKDAMREVGPCASAQREEARTAVYKMAERNRLKQKQGTSMQRITFNAWKNVMTEVRLANSHSDNAAAQTARNKLLRFKENRKPQAQVREGKDSAMLHAVVDGWKQYTAEARNQYACVKHNTKSENAVSHALHKWDKTKKIYLRHEGLKGWLEVLKAAKLQRAKEIHDNKMKSTIKKMDRFPLCCTPAAQVTLYELARRGREPAPPRGWLRAMDRKEKIEDEMNPVKQTYLQAATLEKRPAQLNSKNVRVCLPPHDEVCARRNSHGSAQQ